MKILRFFCFFSLLTLSCQTIHAQEHRHVLSTGKEVKIILNRAPRQILLDVIVNNCEIDGWIKIYTGEDSNDVEFQATYHVVCENGQWVWGCGGHCFDQTFCDNTGLTMQDLLNMASQIIDADTCCRGDGLGGGPCDTLETTVGNMLDYVFCQTIDMMCCDSVMKIIYTQYDCDDSNEVFIRDEFWALYDGVGNVRTLGSYSIMAIEGVLSDDIRYKILNKILEGQAILCSEISSTNN